jgi:GAF domain-containing protein
VLGSLCAIDDQPRAWTPSELEVLGDLAAACSAELRLRIAAERADRARRRTRLLLEASERLTRTVTVQDVIEAVSGLVRGGLDPLHVSITLRGDHDDRLTVSADGRRPLDPGVPDRPAGVPLRPVPGRRRLPASPCWRCGCREPTGNWCDPSRSQRCP